jgi:hypothetical protein
LRVIVTNPLRVRDVDGTTVGATRVTCLICVNGGAGNGWDVVVSDNGDATKGDTEAATNVDRRLLVAGDVVTVFCDPDAGDGGEAGVDAELHLLRVDS